jgi:alpha-ketoglutarate-dependent taurine dioxygenase
LTIMAPSIAETLPIHSLAKESKDGSPSYPAPLKLSGALDQFTFEETTPVIGREFPHVNIVDDLLHASNSDELVRDLAITSKIAPCACVLFAIDADGFLLVSQRGVVFFRAQDNLTDDLQKELVQRLGQLSGKPASSTLHIHPVLNNTSEFGVGDAEISTISSLARKKMFQHDRQPDVRRYDSAQWHSDIQFEPAPADYTSLRLTQLPSSGGDTLWASGYEIYDRFSPRYQKFLEGLTAVFSGDGFIKAAERDPERVKIYTQARGSPLNVGSDLITVHPIVRTNPVTGWKSIYAVGSFPKFINELNSEESEELLKKFYSILINNHDLQVRFKWRNKNDIGKCNPVYRIVLISRLN